MADQITFKLEGIEELQEAFRKLPGILEKKVFKIATRTAAKRLRNEIRASLDAEVTHRTGLTRKSIVYRARRLRRGSPVVGHKVRFRYVRSGKRDVNRAFIGRFIEFGTKRQPAREFYFPTVDDMTKELLGDMISAMAEGVDREAGKLFARQRRGYRG